MTLGRSLQRARLVVRSLIALMFLGCSSGAVTEPTEDDVTRLVPTPVPGPFVIAGASVREMAGNPPMLTYAVLLTNIGAANLRIEYGGCWAFLRLYTTGTRTGVPSYDSGPPGVGCTADSHTVTVPAGSTTAIEDVLLLDPSIPVGHYFASVATAPNGNATVIPAGEIEITR